MKTIVNFCKKHFKLLIFSFISLIAVFIPFTTFAQDGFNFLEIGNSFADISTMIPLVLFLSSGLNNLLSLKKFGKQLVSWLIAIALAYIAWFLKLGMFEGQTWYMAGITGVAVALVANGIFDIPAVKLFLKWLKIEAKTVTDK